MTQKTKSISIIIGVCILLSCSNRSKSEYTPNESVAEVNKEVEEEIAFTAPLIKEESQSTTDKSTQPNFISSLAASANYDDNIHKFIRTAEMKFRVKDVPQATYTIEDIVIKNKGFIIRSAINNENSYSTTTTISKDSSLITHYSNLIADLKLRVPRTQLDTVLKQIAPLALEINYRTIDANDITLQLLSENLKQQRLSKKGKRVSDAISNKGQKLENIMDAEEVLDNTLKEADKTKLAEYDINDQIEYSTITIKLYQSTSEYKEKVVREKPLEEYKAGLGEKAIEALNNGWIIISSLFIFLLNIWPVILIVAVAGVLYSKYKKKKD